MLGERNPGTTPEICMSTLTESTQIVAADGCLSTTIDGETVILHVDAGKYYGFNEVGTYVWDLLQRPRTVEEVCRAVVEEYDVTYDRVRDDVDEIVRELAEKDLVRFDER